MSRSLPFVPFGLVIGTSALLLGGCTAQTLGYGGATDLERTQLSPAGVDDGDEDPIDAVDPADDDDDPTTPDAPGDDDDAVTDDDEHSQLTGFLPDPLGRGVADVEVVVDDVIVALSDGAGGFQLPAVPNGEQVVMTFNKTGYATSWASYVPVEGGENFFSKTLAPVDLMVEFDAEEGINFEIDGTHWFDIPGGTITGEDGQPYSDNVLLEATVWDRQTPLDEGGEFLASPGNGYGVDQNGDEVLLYTFGMFQITLTSATAEALDIGPGFLAQVDLPENTNMQNGQVVPFWDFDGQSDTWIEEDQGVVLDLDNGEQVWEFEPTQGLPTRNTTTRLVDVQVSQQASCNPDAVMVTVQVQEVVSATASGNVISPQGEPVQGARVRVIAEDQTYFATTQTDASGAFSVAIPPVVAVPVGPNGRPIFVEVDYQRAQQPFLWRSDPIPAPAPAADASFGQIAIGSMTCVAGTVLGSNNQPVAGVQVTGSHGGNEVSDSAGNFCMQVPKWQPSSVYALPSVDSSVGFEPVRVRPEPGSMGDCAASCPNVVELRAYDATSCALGEVIVGGEPSDGLRVEAFDNRFPTAPIFATVVEGGEYSLAIPADTDVTLRIGAGDNADSNACDVASVGARSASASCAAVAPLECG